MAFRFWCHIAEPALNALGATVQDLTNGAFKKSILMYSVAGELHLALPWVWQKLF